MKGFLTGSRIYGVPKPDSDIDLVLRVTLAEALILGASVTQKPEYGSSPESCSVRFGDLNLILCYTDEAYDKWTAARAHCKMKSPITRDEAVKIHKECGV